MGFRFRKSFKLMPGVRLNLNKKSFGLSVGGKGFRKTINSNGRRSTSVGIPGTGLYYTKSSGGGSSSSSRKKGARDSGNASGRYCGQCGAANQPDAKFCESCGAPLGIKTCKNITVILWLIFFFPVGIALMWLKTNWHKYLKIGISVFFAIILIYAIATSPSTDTPTESPSASSSSSIHGITGLNISKDELTADLGKPLFQPTAIVDVFKKYGAEITVEDFNVKVENPEILHIEELEFGPAYLTFKVIGDQVGETTIIVETADGAIQANPIHVTVTGEKPTEAPTEAPTQKPIQPPVTERPTAAPQPEKPIAPAAPQQTTYIVNTSTGVFHRASCGHAKRMNAANKAEVSAANSEEMEAKGYTPCGTCIK